MISFRNVSFGYVARRQILKGLDVEFSAGRIYGVLGKNGVGKSTLLHQIMGLIYPQKGRVEVLGLRPEDRQPSLLQNLFFIPEDFELPNVKLQRYVDLHSVFYPNFDKDYFSRILDEFEILNESTLSKLSFGQQKKFFIAFGLACQTAILIMDEPTNGLDIPSKSKFRKLVAASMNAERLFIISTHQVRDLENLIDQVVILDENDLLLDASLEEISEKLLFKTTDMIPEQSLYAEQNLYGHAVVCENQLKQESRVNLEHLFAAATSNPAAFKKLFKH